jgi:NAD(P) transhydrogenase subunit alpha
MISGWAAVYIFLLAAFTGYEVISRVPVILHTPLMSGSNFVHGIVVVGAMVALGTAGSTPGRIIGFVAVLLGTANAVGGYAVTERMLQMFKSSKDARTQAGKSVPAAGLAAPPASGDGESGRQAAGTASTPASGARVGEDG